MGYVEFLDARRQDMAAVIRRGFDRLRTSADVPMVPGRQFGQAPQAVPPA